MDGSMTDNNFKELSLEKEERETLFRCIFEQSSEGILIFQHNGKIMLMNDTFSTMLGVPVLDIVGKPVWEMEQLMNPNVQINKQFILGEQRIKDILSKPQPKPLELELDFYDNHHKLHAFKQILIQIKT
ncbi:MAG: PAS domain S-box protein, partial [ANME-2 cluster archaeon]